MAKTARRNYLIYNMAALGLVCVFVACSLRPKSRVLNIIVINHRSIKLTGLDYAILSEINRDSTGGHWQSLIPVYRMPGDTDLKDIQPVQPGQYRLIDSAVVFTPDTPFIKGRPYFMRCYQYGQNESTWDLIKGIKKPGTAKYIDMAFVN